MSSTLELEKMIANLSLEISSRFPAVSDKEGQLITAGLSLLTQAMMIAESNPAKARQLYSRARRIGTLKVGGLRANIR